MPKHYSKGLFCIGRFQTRTEFESAICFEGEILLTLGPYGGFSGAEMNVQYDGKSVKGQLDQEDPSKWINFFKPFAKLQKIPSRITTLPSTRLTDSLTGSGAVEGGQVSFPSVPKAVVAVRGNAQLTVTWIAPVRTGGSAIARSKSSDLPGPLVEEVQHAQRRELAFLEGGQGGHGGAPTRA